MLEVGSWKLASPFAFGARPFSGAMLNFRGVMFFSIWDEYPRISHMLTDGMVGNRNHLMKLSS